LLCTLEGLAAVRPQKLFEQLSGIHSQFSSCGPGEIASLFARAFELAMQIERERCLGAGYYERTRTNVMGMPTATKPSGSTLPRAR